MRHRAVASATPQRSPAPRCLLDRPQCRSARSDVAAPATPQRSHGQPQSRTSQAMRSGASRLGRSGRTSKPVPPPGSSSEQSSVLPLRLLRLLRPAWEASKHAVAAPGARGCPRRADCTSSASSSPSLPIRFAAWITDAPRPARDEAALFARATSDQTALAVAAGHSRGPNRRLTGWGGSVVGAAMGAAHMRRPHVRDGSAVGGGQRQRRQSGGRQPPWLRGESAAKPCRVLRVVRADGVVPQRREVRGARLEPRGPTAGGPGRAGVASRHGATVHKRKNK